MSFESFHFADKDMPCDPKIIALCWCKLYLFSGDGHVSGDE